MRDLRLEHEMALLRSLMGEAKAFRDITQATIMTEVVVPEHETRFEELRKTLPELSVQFQHEVGLPEAEAERLAGNAEKLFGGVSALPAVIRFTDLDKRKLYDQWHRYYLGLYAVQGRLKMRKERLDALSVVNLRLRRLVFNPFVLLILIGALVLLVLALM
ncbi:MAG: hypothetical protein JW889_10515 [Verrucomicrobia bacterium]|nr:hypothetical protein [Verrucomicrobiota bacterium]